MYSKGVITKEEYDNGNVSIDRIKMFIKDVPTIDGVKTLDDQIKARQEVIRICEIEGDSKMASIHKKMLRKLEEIQLEEGKRSHSIEEQHARVELTAQSQNKEIREHLMEKGTITSMEAIQMYGITRLSARIWDLRDQGMDIKTVMKEGKNRHGNNCRFAQYEFVNN